MCFAERKKQMRVMLVDDEQGAIDMLQYLLKDYDNYEVLFSTTDAAKALDALSEMVTDIIFLDIEMPSMNGLEFYEKAKDIQPDVIIVFVTAYENYAVKAYELGSFDYLLKPVTPVSLRRALDRADKYYRMMEKTSPAKENAQAPVILGKKDGKHYVINFDEALYIEVIQRNAFVFIGSNSYRLQNCIGYWEEFLKPRGWFRSHRAFLINLKNIESITKLSNSVYTIHMKGSTTEVPVSRSYLTEFRQMFGI